MIKRILRTDILYTGKGDFISNGMVAVDNNNRIVEVGADLSAQGVKIEYYQGAICPGFVNTHCHLELSHLKGKVSQKTGIQNFIVELQQIRNAGEEEKQQAIEKANREMSDAGIIAVGDISNGVSTLKTKIDSDIYYHTFVELFGFRTHLADSILESGQQLKTTYTNAGLTCSIVPHSPYSVSKKLFENIAEEQKNSPLSIHNQESKAENEMFENGEGELVEMMKDFGNDMSGLIKNGRTSLQNYLNRLPNDIPLLLVHNTFTTETDILFAEKTHPNLYWCFCPKANLYIENCLPDIPLFVVNGVKCTLGTDSLASNNSLSIWDEIQIIQGHYPEIPIETLIQWGTLNGAKFLGVDEDYGSIEKGKKAKFNWIKGEQIISL